MAGRDGAFGRWLGHEGGALRNGISALMEEAPERSLDLSTMWGHSGKTAIYQSGSRHQTYQTPNLPEPSPDTKSTRHQIYSTRHHIYQSFDLGLPNLQNSKNKFSQFNSHPVYAFCYRSPKGLRCGINIAKALLLTTDQQADLDAFNTKGANTCILAAKGDSVHERLRTERSKKDSLL